MPVVGQTGVVPEGDTIHRTATRLRAALAGKRVVSFSAPRLTAADRSWSTPRRPGAGARIADVEARGKYVLIHFDGGPTLETHMRMSGSWHLYRTGERWRRSRGAARVVIETDDGWSAVCFSAPHVKLVAGRGGRTPAGPHHLGPDLCASEPDLDTAVARFALRPDEHPIAVVLLDQRICCGVGNVYKSEVLFACRVHPDTPVGEVDPETRRRLVATAHRQLRANLDGGPRTTVPGVPGGLAVYGRRGLPCRRCGHPIASGRHGVHARTTYWCPSCQPAPATRGVE